MIEGAAEDRIGRFCCCAAVGVAGADVGVVHRLAPIVRTRTAGGGCQRPPGHQAVHTLLVPGREDVGDFDRLRLLGHEDRILLPDLQLGVERHHRRGEVQRLSDQVHPEVDPEVMPPREDSKAPSPARSPGSDFRLIPAPATLTRPCRRPPPLNSAIRIPLLCAACSIGSPRRTI